MTNRYATAAAWGLALLVGVTASAQSDKQGDQSKGSQGDTQKKTDSDQPQQNDSGQSQKSQSQQKDSSQSQGQTERIRGELAGVSVVGETMVDYSTGRGVVAQFTYLTILGSPSGSREQAGRAGQDSRRNEGSREKGQDQGSSKSQAKDESSNKNQADITHGQSDGSSRQSASRRRNVYQIAVSPETEVRTRGSQGRQGSGNSQGDQGRSAREQSQSALEQLQLGDRVEVEFNRLTAPGQPGAGGQDQGGGAGQGQGQGGSASQSRHGRHRLIRGVAKTITILSTPDQGDDQQGSQGQKGGNSSSEEQQSGSNAQEKKSDGEKKSDQDK